MSIASDSGASIEDIADAAGHVNPNVTRAPAAMNRTLAVGVSRRDWLPG